MSSPMWRLLYQPFVEAVFVCQAYSKYRLHAEGEPALSFPDGYKISSYHGVTLPEKYGQTHPSQWQATWILEE